MHHVARGLDSNGKLKMEVTMEGYVPETNPFTQIDIKVKGVKMYNLVEFRSQRICGIPNRYYFAVFKARGCSIAMVPIWLQILLFCTFFTLVTNVIE